MFLLTLCHRFEFLKPAVEIRGDRTILYSYRMKKTVICAQWNIQWFSFVCLYAAYLGDILCMIFNHSTLVGHTFQVCMCCLTDSRFEHAEINVGLSFSLYVCWSDRMGCSWKARKHYCIVYCMVYTVYVYCIVYCMVYMCTVLYGVYVYCMVYSVVVGGLLPTYKLLLYKWSTTV